MLTGKRPFQKPTSADTASSILNEDPASSSQVTNNIPPALQRVVHRCLEKNREQRFQSASDLAFALDTLRETYRGVVPSPRPDPGVSLLKFVAEHKLALAAGLVPIGVLLAEVVHIIIPIVIKHFWPPPPKITHKQFTFSGDAHAPAISPDGLFVAYVSRKFGEPDTLIVQASNGAKRELARATESRRSPMVAGRL